MDKAARCEVNGGMFLSVFDIFKIGIGPSSSHTMGPMVAAGRFLDKMRSGDGRIPGSGAPARVRCELYGSLAFTGKGHATDRAVLLGFAGVLPDTLEPSQAEGLLEMLLRDKQVTPDGLPVLALDPAVDIIFDYDTVADLHANQLRFVALDGDGRACFIETYCSTGGGFVLTADEMAHRDEVEDAAFARVPFPFRSADEMLAMGEESGQSIAQMKRANEEVGMARAELDARLDAIWRVMDDCIARGMAASGTLPGGLNVQRRASGIAARLEASRGNNQAPPHVANDWMSVYAMAVNEENAAGQKIVTAPTNGAAGVLPAVIKYHVTHMPVGGDGSVTNHVRDMLLTAAAIGGLIKENASISGAEVGCQGEVGSASAMAAAAFCAVNGGSNGQIENAAEIALEHHLGMTCDPIGGLVQVPCIERNGMGAIKAVSAASMALHGDGTHIVSLDACVETMRQTGVDMDSKYRETSLGGLAVNLPAC